MWDISKVLLLFVKLLMYKRRLVCNNRVNSAVITVLKYISFFRILSYVVTY